MREKYILAHQNLDFWPTKCAAKLHKKNHKRRNTYLGIVLN